MLDISPDLSLPKSTVTSTIIIYGGKGMGKTNLASVIAEELYYNNFKFSFIDPLGVAFGLRHGIDKAHQGLEILILGGLHGDIPINPASGTIVADLVADERISVIIDISRDHQGKSWEKNDKVRFVTDYMKRLYERQAESKFPIMQMIDEAARFAPQKMVYNDKLTPACLEAIEIVASEGRNYGIGLTLISQRSARLNKDVAELADVLMAFRIVGPNSIDAIMDWFGDHIPREKHRELVEELRKLARGTAMVISPGWLEVEGIYPIRFRHTFDSSATPKMGGKLRAPGKAHKPDLAKYQERMSETIEKAKADDPRALHSQIARLNAELKKLSNVKPIEPSFDQAVLDRIMNAARDADQLWQNKQAIFIENIKRAIEENKYQPVNTPAMIAEAAKGVRANLQRINRDVKEMLVPPKKINVPEREATGELSKLHREIINGIALLHSIGEPNPTIAQVGAVIGKWHNAGRVRGGFNQTHEMGYAIIEGDRIQLTSAGMQEAVVPSINSCADIHQLWFNRLAGNELSFLRVLLDAHPEQLTLTALGEAVGKDINAGRIRGALNALVDKGLAKIDGSQVSASELLFPNTLV